jgi:branched-chain amino acid transport system permease protein
MRGRPNLFASYEAEQGLLPTTTKKVFAVLLVIVAISIPLEVFPILDQFATPAWLVLFNRSMIFLIAALGLNILTGLAGQVSLGHAFFMGIGAYTAVVLGGSSEGLWGLGLPIWFWLPMAGIIPALVGVVIAPTAVRVRGLYLAIVTLGLVFIGEHFFRNMNSVAGAPEVGREWPNLEFRLWKEQNPLIDFSRDGEWFGISLTGEAKTFFFLLVASAIFVLLAKNLTRTRIGRAFAAVRDRDVAAEIMGVGEYRAKTQAFAISSFYAGISGALLGVVVGRLIPETWNLFLSVQFVAIVLIGGAGTVAGTVLGSFFVVMMPRMVENATRFLGDQAISGGPLASVGDLIMSINGDFGLVSFEAQGPGLSIFQLNQVIYGLLIAVFLISEPLGLFGVWIRIRNYWKGWPFTY